MNKIYEIKLTHQNRLGLFQSGAFSFKQFLSQKTYSVNQNEIHAIVERYDPQVFLLCFEKDNLFHIMRLSKEDQLDLFTENRSLIAPENKIPWKIFKHLLAPAVCLSAAFMPIIFLLDFVFPKNLKPLFLSENCFAPCANVMSEITSVTIVPYFMILGIPLFYFIGCFFATSFFKFKINRPVAFVFPFFVLCFGFIPMTYEVLTDSSVQTTISHWKKDTLNLETISQIKAENRKKNLERSAAAVDEEE